MGPSTIIFTYLIKRLTTNFHLIIINIFYGDLIIIYIHKHINKINKYPFRLLCNSTLGPCMLRNKVLLIKDLIVTCTIHFMKTFTKVTRHLSKMTQSFNEVQI